MDLNFSLASGSVAGRDHRIGIPRNRQDGLSVRRSRNVITAVVTDGCGSGEYSEVGASLFAPMAASRLQHHLAGGRACDSRVLEKVSTTLLSRIHLMAEDMMESLPDGDGPSYGEIIEHYFLFTLLGIVITPEETTVFGLGDGLFAINEQVTTLDPEAGNQPIYLAYALTGTSLTNVDPSMLQFKILAKIRTANLDSFMLAVDGAAAIASRSEESLPGSKDQKIGPLSQFWTDPKYFGNKTGITRRLNLIARDWRQMMQDGTYVMEGGKLPDDTTIIVGRNLAYKAD